MSNKIILKKSSVTGRVPEVTDLDYGELALNYTDGKLYYKTSTNGISSLGGSTNFTQIDRQSYIATAGQTTFNITYAIPYVDVYINGVHLSSEDYTATTGTAIVVIEACNEGDNVDLVGYSGGIISAATKTDGDLLIYNGTTQIWENFPQSSVTVGNAAQWSTARTLSFTGDATGSMSVDGSANASAELTLANSGVTAGEYGSASLVPVITVDDKGRITSASTISVAGVSDFTFDSNTHTYTIDTADGGSYSASGDLVAFTTDDLTEGSSNRYYTDARARESISVTDSGGDGSLAYDSATGVITYTGPSATEVRAHLSAGTGVTYSNGQFSIGQDVSTTSNVSFGDITVGNGVTTSTIYLGATTTNYLTTSGNGKIVIKTKDQSTNYSKDVWIQTGNSTLESGASGNILIKTGNAVTGSGAGAGSITIYPGDSDGVYAPDVLITGGSSVSGTTSIGGHVSIKGGSSTTTTGTTNAIGGNLYLYGGSVTSANDFTKTTGNVYIEGGGAYGSGSITYGTVNIGRTSGSSLYGTSAVHIGTSLTTIYGSTRSPIYYDSDNTGYYVDPNGTSNLNGLTVGGVTANSVQFNTSAGVTVATGQLAWNSTDGTLDIGLLNGSVLQVGQESHVYAKATEAISNGQLVMFAGAQGDHILVSKANLSALGFKDTWIVGIATQDFTTNAYGYVTWFGKVNGINTSSWPEGTILYADSSVVGGLTSTRPEAPNHIIQVCAVLRQHAVQGVLLVRPSFGMHMSELHDVYYTTPNNGDVLKWNSTNSRWQTYAGTTDNITEGSNLYYTNARVQTKLGSVSGHIIPDTNITYDLGSATNRFRDLYLSGNSISLGNITLTDDNGTFLVTDANSDPIAVSLSANSTDDLAEGPTNLYYTDTRVGSYLTTNSYATQLYVSTAIANLIDSAPSTLDTLNELAAALGDDPSFATTISTSIGTKAASSITISAGTELSGGGDLTSNRTINHADVSRSDTTSSASPARNGSFTVVDSVTTNARGHVTAVNTKTVTLPDFEIVTITSSLTLSTSWQDTGINGAELSSGSYMVQVESVSDYGVGGGQYQEYYTGVMSWFSGNTNNTSADEIILHRAGHAPNAGAIFLRVLRTTGADPDDLKLQISGLTNNTGAYTYTFKFRRMI